MLSVGLLSLTYPQAPANGNGEPATRFPAPATILVEYVFAQSEGIAFNGEGRLFVSGNRALNEISPDGSVRMVVELDSNLGLAPIGERDILYADFGPTNIFRDGENENNDGIVWRITPEGEKRVVANGIADPNFILLRKDGSFLVSDDGVDDIYLVSKQGQVRLFTDRIKHPNGLVFSLDAHSLFVAQIFKQIHPIVPDNRVWRLDLNETGEPIGDPVVVAAPGEGGHDGLAMDERGRVYVAENGLGRIWRIDPATGETLLIAQNVPGAASIAFGEGIFDRNSIYITSTRFGTIWKVDVGVAGTAMQR